MFKSLVRECQWIGPEQDPRKGPVHYCGAQTIDGKSYCHEHYWRVYAKGTSVNGRRRERAIEREIADIKLQQEIEETVND